jgi:hypothetical protein
MKRISFESGLTTRSVLAVIYAVVVFTPAMMYLQLVTGQSGFSVAWFTLLLWVKLSELTGKKLTKHEALVVYLLSGIEFIPIFLVYRLWFRQSDIVKMAGFGSEIPDWYAPSPETGVFELRTFFHQAWIIPIIVYAMISFLGILLGFALAFFAREVLIEIENLPFPMQEVAAVAVSTISEGESTSIQYLSVFATFGFIYGFFLYALPFILQAWTGQIIYFLPIPWFDFNYFIEPIIPGASLGIATDLIPYATGLVLPLRAAFGLGIGSLAIYTIGNWLLVKYNLSPIPWWIPGMNIQLAAQRSILNFWSTIIIGLSLAAGLAPIIRHPSIIISAVKTLFKPYTISIERKTDPISPKIILIMLLISFGGGIALFASLVPNFLVSNPWFILFMIFTPIISTLAAGRMLGEAGTSILQSGNFQNVLYLSSGYPNVDVWFAPSIATYSGHGYLAWFKTAQLTKTSSLSIFKTFWIVWPISFLIGILYLQILWSIAPMPSGRYPGTEIYWPIDATFQALWIKGKEVGFFPPSWIGLSFILGTVLYFLQDILRLPISFASIAAGCGTLPPYGVSFLLGGFLSLFVQKLLGKEWWSKNKFIISAGLTMGESIAITLSVAISLIINSVWMHAF